VVRDLERLLGAAAPAAQAAAAPAAAAPGENLDFSAPKT
jgi:hypothetical protein